MIPLVFKYQIKALDLINKKLAYEEFEERIYATIKHVQNNNNCDLSDECFIFDSKQAHIHIPYYQLLFVDTSGASHNLILHSLYGQIEIKGTLLQVLESEPRLFRCHRSFVINLSNVVSIDKQNRIITFKNGSKCDISRDKVKEVIKGRTYYSCFFKEKIIESNNIDKEILELADLLRQLAVKNLSRREVMSEEMNLFYKKISDIKEKELNIVRGIGSFGVVR
ncbi:response regulator [Streptococcus parauberis KCTC 11537]|nr:response regulator [Streptococcus parauberis KCTC 11537]